MKIKILCSSSNSYLLIYLAVLTEWSEYKYDVLLIEDTMHLFNNKYALNMQNKGLKVKNMQNQIVAI